MRALIVYESMFGNTENVAREIAKGLSGGMQVEVANVDDAPENPEGFDLVVAGGPTHVHGMTRRATRDAARKQATEEIHSRRTGLREWLDGLTPAMPGTRAATFDTRIDKPAWLVGSAARSARKRLRRKGYRVGEAASFVVSGAEMQDVAPGELDRARAWGESLAAGD